ncbi:MAG: DEAD/DEAH box helicase [Fermentimonas sp.]|nr:DEAD/DEAH box helicase [Fermentimonas sp.]
MLSLQQAIEIKESIVSYLKATFTFRKKSVAQAFHDFIYHPTQGMFKGPYISLKLPFVKADAEEISNIPLDIIPHYSPYDHQVKAWNRLSAHDKEPEATIITTGTGSGKTEAFLYPILDYCYHQQHRPGIKVIIMYPMNALATDQAKRLAEVIHEDERLRGKIRAGLFIGESKTGQGISRNKVMEPDHIIEDRETILDSPPDILLTNFKMLDYALMKHNYNKLWRHNFNDTDLLKFLVLDELHTYDGAQGTDVANLIRRLKLKLKIKPGQLCPIGTSATIGSGDEAPVLLAEYAEKIFGEKITEESIIGENRVDVERFFDFDEKLLDSIPLPFKLKDLVYHESTNFDDYLQAHIDAWQQERESLGFGLKGLKIVKDLMVLYSKGQNMLTLDQVIQGLSILNENYRKLPQWDEANRYSPKERVLESLLTLISIAKQDDDKRMPFIYLQVQLWVRELSGVQYTLEQDPKFSFRDQIDAQKEISALPPWYCRECNSSGWLGVKPEDKDYFIKNINEVYNKFFDHNKNLYFILPKGELSQEDLNITGYKPDTFQSYKLNPEKLSIVDDDTEGIEVQAFRKFKDNRSEHICPCCNTENTVTIVGTKIPTLSSIAVSQTLATDLDPAEDKDRKVLAFTNSVQDAAHQAGFVESRNYRFTLRASIQKVINLIDHPMLLSDLSDAFIGYWKEHADSSGNDSLSGYLYRFFPKDKIGNYSPENYLTNGVYANHFLKEFDLRVQWEIFSEFGFNSRIGRTLEKTGASSVFFDKDSLEKSWDNISSWIDQNDVSGTIKKEVFLKFTNMILHRSRNRGAVDHVFLSKFRGDKLKLRELNWLEDSRHFLNPRYGPRFRLPKMLTSRDSRSGLLDTTRATNTNWFHSYFRKSFIMAAVTTDFINEFYDQWLNSLVDEGLLLSANTGESINYAISPHKIWVVKDVKQFSCNKCEDVIYTQDMDQLTEGAACLSYRCTGTYHREELEESNYYKAVYNRNRFPRVYAAEHTGLLLRESREELEYDFKKRERFNSVNTLIATSTLEMGIDIGDLNTAYNNSTPPLPSNFMQRVGRAGRKSGSSVIINFAKNQNHDLYYYAEPNEMMEGDINTPGCYLEAKDILRRHFTAYCFDSWTTSNPEENIIPNTIGDLKLHQQKITNEFFFINRFISFIKSNRDSLLDNFIVQYTSSVRERAFKEIEDSIDSGLFYEQLLSVFIKIQEEFNEMQSKLNALDEEISVLKLAQGDPLVEEYAKAKKSILGIKRSINKRLTLEHLTNVGVLPNYAFPETGVQLNAHIWQMDGEGATNVGVDKDYEITRPASQAIRELAPENYFYTQGYRFEISGVNTFDWDEKNKHRKRFCSKCDYIEIDSLSKTGNCPKCGDVSWSSASNIHEFVKLTAVRSYITSSQAKLDDNNDDRDSRLYQIIQHVNFANSTSNGAWVLKEIPFGIEFVSNATITTINYGRQDVIDARRLKVNDQEVMTKGFVTCKHCGKSVSSNHLINEAKDFHYGYCKHRNKVYENQSDEVFEEIYLFREFNTEILKIILPVQKFNTEADIRMFQAGLELGLKRYFKGNPSHIKIMDYKEFNQHTSRFDRFLLLYDTIPGGSGYLEELFSSENFTQLLKNSYESIRDCTCQHNGHDGCYRCIYSYGNQYKRDGLSRERAEEWFSKIYKQTESWEKNNRGLTNVTNTGRIEESELEDRFINLVEKWSEKDESCKFSEKNFHGIPYYEIEITTGDVNAIYQIRPQVVLGPKDGIEYSTRVDFLIVCIKYDYKGKEYRKEIPRIALYLDGFQFHASKEHNVFEKDIAIRKAITSNSWFKVWTLTWEDLDYFERWLNKEGDVKDDLFMMYHQNFASNYLTKLLPYLTRDHEKINLSNGFSNVIRLISLLAYPIIEPFPVSHFTFLVSWTSEIFSPSYNPEDIDKLISGDTIEDNYIIQNLIKDYNGLIPVEGQNNFKFADWRIWVNFKKKEVLHNLELSDTKDVDKNEWQQFWSLFNIFQSANFLKRKSSEVSIEITDEELDLVAEILPLYESEYHDLIKKAVDKNIITMENINYLDSLVDEQGEVIADADLVFGNIKVVVNPFSDESRRIFEEHGYKIIEPGDVDLI